MQYRCAGQYSTLLCFFKVSDGMRSTNNRYKTQRIYKFQKPDQDEDIKENKKAIDALYPTSQPSPNASQNLDSSSVSSSPLRDPPTHVPWNQA